MLIPELLAPAGNMERLKFALHYGADAAYCGGKMFGLRSFADNFTLEELRGAADYAHSLSKKLYVTVNAFLKNSDLPQLEEYLPALAQTGVDALIVTDPAVLMTLKERAPEMEFHISTQANTLNYRAAQFWEALGASRIILAREVSLEEIREIRARLRPETEIECFVHGAMCVSYSGRCLLSNYLSGRDGNRGECVQPCRWSYELRERGKNGEWMPIEEDGRGTYLLNSRDLMMIEHLGALRDAGVSSFKIEGRMKTAFYVASVVSAYRRAIDDLLLERPFDRTLLQELGKLRHRPYTTGFYFGGDKTEQAEGSVYLQTHEFVGVVLEYDGERGRALVEQRNRFFRGDALNVLSPGGFDGQVRVSRIVNLEGEEQESAPHPRQHLWLDLDGPVAPCDILRRKTE